MTGTYSKGALRGEALIPRFTALENCYGNLKQTCGGWASIYRSSSSTTALFSSELTFLLFYNKSNIVNEP